ncbi:MAG: hypothetical protein H7240_02920 [Glaciimonas sp.]|nr:hypothetical protein [Glaciimonas sp.]
MNSQTLARPPISMQKRIGIIAKLFLAVIIIVIIEGALRKWISQGLTIVLVALRDLMAVYAIVLAIKTGQLRFKTTGALVLLGWTVLVMIWSLLQEMVNGPQPFILLLGLRFWLLYLWLAYAAAVCVTEYEFKVISKYLQASLFLMLPLVVIQHFQPPEAFINKQLDDDSFIFQVAAGIVRTTGTFSFTTGYSCYLSLVTPFMFALASPGLNFWRRKWIPVMSLGTIAAATAVSGSRTAISFLVIIFVVYLISFLFYTRNRSRSSSASLLISVVLIIGSFPYILSGAIDANKERFQGAAEVENFSGRTVEMLVGSSEIYRDFPFWGIGIGKGANAAGSTENQERAFLAGEFETERIIRSGGVLGVILIILKICVCWLGLFKSIQILGGFGNSLPLMLWVSTTGALFLWTILGQLSVNALGYLLFGVALMSLRFPSIRA